MSKLMVLVASAIFVTGVVVLARQRSVPEGLPGASAPVQGRADAVLPESEGPITPPVGDAAAANSACRSEGAAQRLCLAELKQAARLVAN